MALAAALDDLKANRRDTNTPGTTGGMTYTPFFGGRDQPGQPHAALARFDAGRVSRPHFHKRDQFQVVIDGHGTLGRHSLTPYTIHFSRAYTPYGPLVSGADTGMTFFVIRADSDPGSQRLPQALDQLKQVRDRKPWQISRTVTFPASSEPSNSVVLQAVPDITDDHGLAAYTLSMQPNARSPAPDAARGDGQFIAVVKGGLIHDGKERKTYALVYVSPDEDNYEIQAGPAGLEALVLNFPSTRARTESVARSAPTATGRNRFQCTLCSFVYDEAAGLPEEGIAPGTRWEDIPDTWNCPDCSASKADFQVVER